MHVEKRDFLRLFHIDSTLETHMNQMQEVAKNIIELYL